MDLDNMTNNLYKTAGKTILDNAISIISSNVEALALQRRIVELLGIPEYLEKYDEEFTKAVDEQSNRFSKMDMSEIIAFMKNEIERMNNK